VHFKRWDNAPSQLGHPDVLYNDGVCSGLGDGDKGPLRFTEFVVEYQRIERDEPLDATGVQRLHHLREFGQLKADLGPGAEMSEPKIHRIGARLHGGFELRPVAGRAHQFGFGLWVLHRHIRIHEEMLC
jgi:hypothetical protein